MALPKFFSVERMGYTKISDLFADVMKDMIDNGFTLVNSSNGYPLTSWKATVVNGGSTQQVGTKLYIASGTRPFYSGIERVRPYVEVTEVSTIGTTTGVITKLSDVVSDYDAPIWTVEPTNPVSFVNGVLPSATAVPNITANIANVAIGTDSLGRAINAPARYSFTLEASGDVDPLNESRPSPEYAFVPEIQRQPWRVQFVIADEQKVSGSIATPLQMSYDEVLGRISISKITNDSGAIVDNVGAMGAAQPGGVFSDSDLNQGFYNRKIRVAAQEKTFPLSYMLTITDRGFFLGVYEGSWSTLRASTTANSNYFNWVLCQRPVDRTTGVTLTKGKAPVFNVNGVNYKYYKNVVREADILHPTAGPLPKAGSGFMKVETLATTSSAPKEWFITGSAAGTIPSVFISELQPGSSIYDKDFNFVGEIDTVQTDIKAFFSAAPLRSQTTAAGWYYTEPNVIALRTLADRHSPDSHAIFNGSEQVALTEEKTYLLTFPHNLTTPRFRYTEELDMIGLTSSDVVMAGQDIQFSTYGEWGPRTYRALPASGAMNTGLRLSVLWKPAGPKWSTPAGSIGTIQSGDEVNIDLLADSAPPLPGDPVRATPIYTIARGSLPLGLSLTQAGKILGTVGAIEYEEPTVIKFTVSAAHVEEGQHAGYALRDFYFTYTLS